MATREGALAALQTALAGAATFGMVTRRLMAPEDMATPGLPGLAIVVHHEQTHRPGPTAPPRRTLSASVVVYVDVGASDPNAIPDSVLNPILDAIDAVFDPRAAANLATDGRCTLGGAVWGALISGETIRAPGDRTGKGVALIPVDLILP